MIAPIPRYNSSYLNGKSPELRYPKADMIIGSANASPMQTLKNEDSKSKYSPKTPQRLSITADPHLLTL